MCVATLGALLTLTGCGQAVTHGAAAGGKRSAVTAGLARWTAAEHVFRPVDLAGPTTRGALLLAAAGKLYTQAGVGGRILNPAPRYHTSVGLEPYIASVPSSGHGCFTEGAVYGLRVTGSHAVVSIIPGTTPRVLARLTAPGLPNGIAFDGAGAFEHRLLVTVSGQAGTTVDAIDCRGHVRTLTARGPRVEGGIAIAPANFGRFGRMLIAPDEISGRIYAIDPAGGSGLVATSDLPAGQDVGVESEGFVPAGTVDALLADRLTPHNPHPGDDVILRLRSAALRAAGVRRGDLLVAGEGGAQTDAIRCGARGCRVKRVAVGPRETHAEGHIVFVRAR